MPASQNMTTEYAVSPQLPHQEEEVQCVVIPLAQCSLLLPNVCVAEILPWRRIKPLPDAPDWFAGVLGWRGEMLPVVDFDSLAGNATEQEAGGRCLIVMNRSSAARGTSFYALLATGLPRLLAVAGEDLESDAAANTPYIALSVRLGTEDVVIPDLRQIEQDVQKFGFGA